MLIKDYHSLFRIPDLTKEQLAEPFKKKNPDKYNRAVRLAEMYIKWCNKFNIEVLLAWSQMIHETGWLKFTGDVPEFANNFCGHGATGGGVYNTFETEELGILAHLTHLAWYVFQEHMSYKDEEGDLYCSKKYDSRHFANSHFKYTGYTMKELNGRWAVPGKTYAQSIVKTANLILNTEDIIDEPKNDKFDIIIQMGHIGRTSGATGARDEQKFTKALGEALYMRFRNSGCRVRLMGADNWLIPKPNNTKLFFSIHYDGSSNSNARGSSVGYPPESDVEFAHTMHNTYTALSKFPQRRDNYTSNLAKYYAWRRKHVVADWYCLLEHGFGSNPTEYNWMFSNIERIADCHFLTLLGFLSKNG